MHVKRYMVARALGGYGRGMNLHAELVRRAERGAPVRVGLIGAGKFGTMFLAAARTTPGLHVAAIADLAPDRVRDALARTGWPTAATEAPSLTAALADGTMHVGDDAEALIAAPGMEVVIEATGSPGAGIRHALLCAEHGRDVVMVTVEADVLAGPLLAQRVQDAGGVYALAYGDQPALICELVDWARTAGLEVVCAGKGTKYLPAYHASTPDTVWQHYDFSPEEAARLNAQLFNSFVDGTKSAIEMAAVANATGLAPAPDGLGFPPAGVSRLAEVLRPRAAGGVLAASGTVEVVSSLERDGSPIPDDLRQGVYVVVEAPSDYVAQCWAEYGVRTDASGRYSALHRPYHYIGLELGISVAAAAVRREATGAPAGFHADVVATAKRPLAPGDVLDGEGGRAVWGRLVPARDSLAAGLLPIGLAGGVTVTRPVAEGAPVARADVELDASQTAVRVRDELEAAVR